MLRRFEYEARLLSICQAVCAAELGRAMLRLGEYDQAERLLLGAFERLSSAWPGNPSLWRIAYALVNLYIPTDFAAETQ